MCLKISNFTNTFAKTVFKLEYLMQKILLKKTTMKMELVLVRVVGNGKMEISNRSKSPCLTTRRIYG